MIHIKLRATVRSGRNLCGCRTFDRTAGGGDAGAEPIEQGEAAMKSRLKLNVLAAALAGAAVLGVPAAFADAHGHGATEVHKLTLNQGKKWATDEPLRKGMAEIRTLVEAQYTGIHKGTLKPAEYAALGERIEAQVGYVVANCKLDPQADANLHVILEVVLEGVETMKGKENKSPRAGAGKVVAALNDYGKYFDHPGWKRL
jgi:hypothetical protein